MEILREFNFQCEKLCIDNRVIAVIKIGRNHYANLLKLKNVSSLAHLRVGLQFGAEQRNRIKALMSILNDTEES